MATTTFYDRATPIVADWLNDVDALRYDTDVSGGAGALPYDASLAYAADTIGWAARLNRPVYNVLQDVPVAEWAAIVAGSSTTNLATYIATANTNAAAAALPLFFPGGTFCYTPTAVLDITNWMGAGPDLTSIKCDCTSYSGVVFRMPGSTEISGLRIYEDGLSKVATGLHLSAANVDEFTGHQRLRRLTVQGFSKNIVAGNTFMVTGDQVRCESGTEGLYCAPADAAGDNGYVTTHVWINCWFASNVRNVYYSPELTSKCVTFLGGSIESATGAAEQAYFANLRHLAFRGMYFEGASTIPVLRMNSSNYVVVEEGYFNDTGGVSMNSQAGDLTLKNSQFITATDLLTDVINTNRITIDTCDMQASGNILTAGALSITNSAVNGVLYAEYSASRSGGYQADTYGTAVTPTLRDGSAIRYVVTDGVAFTVNAPVSGSTSVSLVPGTIIRINLKNTSGGAMGAVTWNGVFLLPTLTLPATAKNRWYEFLYDGTNWCFVSQTQADVPNS